MTRTCARSSRRAELAQSHARRSPSAQPLAPAPRSALLSGLSPPCAAAVAQRGRSHVRRRRRRAHDGADFQPQVHQQAAGAPVREVRAGGEGREAEGTRWAPASPKVSRRAEPRRAAQVKRAIEKGNIEGAKIYAQNAIRKKTEQLNYLKARATAPRSQRCAQRPLRAVSAPPGARSATLDTTATRRRGQRGAPRRAPAAARRVSGALIRPSRASPAAR